MNRRLQIALFMYFDPFSILATTIVSEKSILLDREGDETTVMAESTPTVYSGIDMHAYTTCKHIQRYYT